MILTFTGRHIDPFKLESKDISIRDIAHALSMTCRWGGHTSRFYSVAEHCVRLVEFVPERHPNLIAFDSRDLQRWLLVHDANEAYLTDAPKPDKDQPECAAFVAYEKKLQDVIEKHFDVTTDSVLRRMGKSMDVRILGNEAEQLLPLERLVRQEADKSGRDEGAGATAPPQPDLSKVPARQNLNETAFFFPHLVSDTNGVVRMTFTMPEALTTWRFMGFAHDRDLRAGYLEGKTVTAKDLMVQPNPPRFLREGDIVEFTVKVSNQSDSPQSGTVRLNFTQALSGDSADLLLGNRQNDQPFDIPAKQSRSVSWRIAIPDGCGFLS